MGLSFPEIARFLSTIEPFRSLTGEELRRLALKARERTFGKGETIFQEGDAADSIWILHKGRIQILKYTLGAKALAIESLAQGELFGTLCRLGGGGRNYPCTAVSSEPSTTLQIADHVFLEYYMRSAGLVRGVCTLCSQRLKDVQDLRCVGQESVAVRVATILLRLYQVHGDLIPFTKKEVSELSGTTLETTFRTLAQFQKKGWLESLRGKIQIKKAEPLKEVSEGG